MMKSGKCLRMSAILAALAATTLATGCMYFFSGRGYHPESAAIAGLCAVPAVHGETGRHTFVIDIRNKVYKKDNGGKPVTVFPDVEEKDGWAPASM